MKRGSTVYNLKKDKINLKFVYFNNGEIDFKLDLAKIINNVDIVHLFGIWTLNHIKTALLSKIKKKINYNSYGSIRAMVFISKI